MKSLKVATKQAQDGSVLLVLLGEDGTQHPLSSRYAPLREAERMLAPHQSQAEGVRLVFCLGAGHLALNHLILKTFKQAICIFVEANEALLDEAQKRMPKNSERLRFCGEANTLPTAKELLRDPEKRPVLFLHNRAQLHWHDGFYPKTRKDIQDEHNKRAINIATMSRFERLWLRNLTQNTEAIVNSEPCQHLKGLCENTPILVLASGPSLAEDLDLVRRRQANAFLMALDTTTKTLLRNDIFPDMVVVVDPQKANSKYIENLPESLLKDLIVVAEPAVCPKGLRHQRNLFMFDTIFPYYNLLCECFGRKGSLDMGGSVATTAYEMVQLLSCSAACFVGLDLCTTNQSYHSPGTMYEEEWFSEVERLRPYETRLFTILNPNAFRAQRTPSGRVAYIDAKFILFRRWFESKLRSNALPIFNAAKDSLPIEGMQPLSLGEFFKQHAPKPLDKKQLKERFKERCLGSHPQKEQTKAFLLALREVVDSVEATAKTSEQALQVCSKILQKVQSNQNYDEESMQLGSLDLELQKPSLGKPFVNITMQGAIHGVGDRPNPRALDVYENSRQFYEALVGSSRLNLQCLNKVLRRVEKGELAG